MSPLGYTFSLGEASFKKNWFFSEFFRKGGGVSPNPKFPNQKKIEIFLDFFAERGGGLTQSKISVIRNCLFFFGNGGGGLSQSKISLSEKTEIFVGFFLPKGGGVSPIPRGFYHKILIFVIKYSVFSSNTQFFF